MLTTKLLRAVSVGAVVLGATAVATLAATPANAAVIGSLSVAPATGTDTSPITLNSSALCPGTATNLIVTLSGTGFSNAVAVGNAALSSFQQANGGYVVPLAGTMRDLANQQSPAVTTLGGRYDLTLTCRTAFNPASLGDFTGSIFFTSNTTYQSTDPNQAFDTTTVLAATPASPQQAGTSVTLTATVTTTPAGTATGTVQFMDGATALGSPLAVNGSGVATLVTSALAVGSHSLTAVFTGSNATMHNSTSAAVPYQITAAPARDTTTALAVSPATANSATLVTLTATVAPATGTGTPTGTVTFADGATQLGSAPLSAGTAAFTSTFPAGTHTFTASYHPADPTVFNASTSPAIQYDVTAFTGATASQTVTTTVAAGSLTISVANTSPVVLPTPVLAADGSKLTTGGDINPVTVTDTRAGNPGWTVSGQVGDFAGPGTASINGSNLGWTPSVLDKGPSQTVNPGAVVAPAPAVAPGAPPADPAQGLKVAGRTLATAPAGSGIGTAHLSASLALNVPTTTVAGTYSATLTLTAI